MYPIQILRGDAKSNNASAENYRGMRLLLAALLLRIPPLNSMNALMPKAGNNPNADVMKPNTVGVTKRSTLFAV